MNVTVRFLGRVEGEDYPREFQWGPHADVSHFSSTPSGFQWTRQIPEGEISGDMPLTTITAIEVTE